MKTLIQRRLFSRKLKGAERQWMDRHVNDQYVKQSKLQAYRSRASFKLIEMDSKHKLFQRGMRVIDIGASPGGWSQVIAEKVQSIPGQETVVAVDLLEMNPIKGVKFVHGDIEKEEVQEKISEMLDFEKADIVCSDAVPDFIGERFVDHMSFCDKNLKKGGSLLMKIMQGPAEKELFEHSKYCFDHLQRVKPSASRQESKEIYLLGRGYDESKEPEAVELRKEKEKIASIRDQQEFEKVCDDLVKEGKGLVQGVINDILKSGHEVPEELKKAMNESELGKGIDVEQKMSLREQQKARKKTEEEQNQHFYEQTGIKDESKDFNFPNLIKKYERDMQRYEKKMKKMKMLDKQGIDYEADDIQVTDDEAEQETPKRPEEQTYEDEPYKAVQDEEKHFEEEYDRIRSKLKEMEGSIEDPDNLNTNDDRFKKYKDLLEEIEEWHDIGMRQSEQQAQDQDMKDEIKEMERLYKEDLHAQDSYYQKKSKKEQLKKTGGVRSDSPVWNDD